MSHRLSASERGPGPYLWRFTPLDRALHAALIVSFYGLLLTGTPLLFSYTGWARTAIRLLGGVSTAALIHRMCAIITFGYFFTHLAQIAIRWRRHGGKAQMLWGARSMVPRGKDARDLAQMLMWFVGRASRPRFGRYSYMEKFEYWGVFWGTVIMGTSGLMLWFPEWFAIFLPGWIFNIATILHGREALLALGIVFTIHFFNVHLRPGKFPIDLVIFTGRATEQYMQEEHPLEYERLRREGRLEASTAPATSRVAYLWSLAMGFTALAVGVGLLGLVFWALII